MSRICRKPVTVPKGVSIDLQGNTVAVKGPRGETCSGRTEALTKPASSRRARATSL